MGTRNTNLWSSTYPDMWMLGGYMFSYWHRDGKGKSVIRILRNGVPDALNLVINPGDKLYITLSNGTIEANFDFIVRHAEIEGTEIAIYTDSFVLPERWDGSQYKICTVDCTISNYNNRGYISSQIEYTQSVENVVYPCGLLHPVNFTKYFQPRSDQYQEIFYIDCTGNDYDVIPVTGKPVKRTPKPILYSPSGIDINPDETLYIEMPVIAPPQPPVYAVEPPKPQIMSMNDVIVARNNEIGTPIVDITDRVGLEQIDLFIDNLRNEQIAAQNLINDTLVLNEISETELTVETTEDTTEFKPDIEPTYENVKEEIQPQPEVKQTIPEIILPAKTKVNYSWLKYAIASVIVIIIIKKLI